MRLNMSDKSSYKGVLFLICVVFMAITAFFAFFLSRAEPIFKERAADAATQEIRRQIDSVAAELMSDFDIFNENSSENELSVVELNTAEMNRLRTEFSQELSNRLSETHYTKINISSGSLFNNNIFQGVGFKIPVRIFFGSISNIEIKDEFISAGINQTKYRATLEISVSSSVVSAFFTDCRDINVSLPICEKIFIGKVPNYYIPSKG